MKYDGEDAYDGNNHQQLNQAKRPGFSGLFHRSKSNVGCLVDNVRLGAHPAEMPVVSGHWSVGASLHGLGDADLSLLFQRRAISRSSKAPEGWRTPRRIRA